MPGDALKTPAPSESQNFSPARKPSIDFEDNISPQNQDVLLQLSSLIHLAEGFRLGFVKCNQPVQSRQLAERLKKMLAGEVKIIEVELKDPVSSLRTAVLQALDKEMLDGGKKAVMVYGFERSISSEGPVPALEELNLSREQFSCDFTCPFLLWLPDYALTRLAREAPDFWGWRSGVFEFSPEKGLMAGLEKTTVLDFGTDNLDLNEKRERAAALEGLLRDYYELERGKREDRAMAWVLLRVGIIQFKLGEYDEACKHIQQSLDLFNELNDKSGISRSLYQKGLMAQDNDDLAEARRLFQESLKIEQEMGDKRGMAATLHQMGMMAQDNGDLVEARKLYQESLRINQELRNKSGAAITLHQMGNMAYDTGNLAEARKLYQESLKIKQEMGNKRGVAAALHQMGNMAYDTGDLAEARKLYQESLRINQELGNKRDMATTLAQSSLLEEKEGNRGKALEHIKQAETLFLELKSPMAARAQKVHEILEESGRKS